jgi:hypothetical protein
MAEINKLSVGKALEKLRESDQRASKKMLGAMKRMRSLMKK